MIINSFSFLLFFSIVFFIYYFPLKEKTKAQNWLLLIASYIFYGIANWKMIPILLVATFIFYFLGIEIRKGTEKKASLLTTLGVIAGVGLLFYFKYLDFFIESFVALFNSIGLHPNLNTFNIIFPLGISFFTFRLISYVIEIHRGKIEPEKDFAAFATYVAFFPTIMSGPIDRPNDFIPQLHKKRIFSYETAMDGTRQILWGIFKKMVIADNLAVFVNAVWTDLPAQNSPTLFIAAVLYTMQMYADFSGYSDMAIGVGKILGFRITINFKYPFFVTNIAEFWRRWHISLTSWVTDYVFMPLNIKFRDYGKWGMIWAIIINMIIIGIWHGANWTFAVFGLYHGLLFIPLVLSGSFLKKSRLKTNKYDLPRLKDFINMGFTFLLVTVGLIIFRAEFIGQAFFYISKLADFSNFVSLTTDGLRALIPTLLCLIGMIMLEWKQREKEYPLQIDAVIRSKFIRIAVMWALIVVTVLFSGEEQTFIYMQF